MTVVAGVPPILDVRGLVKRFGDLEVLKGIDFAVQPQELVFVVGQSGSGKSTLLRCHNFMERPSAGVDELAGRAIGRAAPGKADAGSLFTSSISSTAFGPRGTQTILAKITIGAAATFFIVALMLGFGVGGGQRSLMEGGVAPLAPPTPAATPAAPAGSQETFSTCTPASIRRAPITPARR